MQRDLMFSEAWSGISAPTEKTRSMHAMKKGGNMKKLFALFVLALSVSVPSFGAEHVVTHSAEVAGKESYKTARLSARKADEVGKAVLKFLF